MKAAIYIRKSREDKNKPGHRLTVQREQLPAHARAQGWAVEIYDDGHASAALGKTENLTERARLENDIRAGRIQVILCIELARLSRDESLQDYVAWLHLCSERGVKLATPSRVLDPAHHSDWMLLLMEGGFSSVEMKVLQGRMKEGRDQAFRAGKWLGGTPPPPYIYDHIKKRPVVDPDLLEEMETLWEMVETKSAKAVAEELGKPEISVRRAISDERLLLYQALRLDPETGGYIHCDWEPVMDLEQADRIRAGRRTRRSYTGVRRQYVSLLSGLGILKCGYCGRTAKTHNNSKRRLDGSRLDYYGCQAKNKLNVCPRSRLIPQVVLDLRVLDNIFNTMERMSEIRKYWEQTIVQDFETQKTALQDDKKDVELKKQRLIEAITLGVVELSDAKEKLVELNSILAVNRQSIRAVSEASTAAPDWDTVALTATEFNRLDGLDQRTVISHLLAEISVYRTYAILTYRFPRAANGDRTARIHLPESARGKCVGRAPVYKL